VVVPPIDPAVQAIIDELRWTIARLEKVIEEKDQRIAELERTVEEWKRGHRARPRKGSKKKRSDKRKKPGRKKGHEGSQREIPDKIDKTVERTKDECDHCHGALTPTGETREVVIENVIPARVEVERNVLFEYRCEGCGQIHWGKLPPEYGDEPLPGTSKLGPGALGIALNLRYDMRLPFHKIAQHFDKHVGLKITPAVSTSCSSEPHGARSRCPRRSWNAR
jgi:transposase